LAEAEPVFVAALVVAGAKAHQFFKPFGTTKEAAGKQDWDG
jgi:hypothetical protein